MCEGVSSDGIRFDGLFFCLSVCLFEFYRPGQQLFIHLERLPGFNQY